MVACDMPLFSGKLAKAMLQAGEGFDAVICQDRAGRIHPLCGIYSKQCLPAIESMIARGNYKITDIMKAVPSLIFSLETSVFSDMLLSNINTPEALEALRQDKSLERSTPIDCIAGGCCVTSSL